MTTEPALSTIATVKVKKEDQCDEVKNFVETAMNELLGLYGYEGIDNIDLPSKTKLNSNIGARNNSSDKASRQDDNSLNHNSSRENSTSPCSGKAVTEQEILCGWCQREVPETSPKFLATADGPRYCSESCFTQSRRASFKKAKTCDWCRHVKHAVSYVDFQDGASQLQFCSDKCLNQYKMQIFCKETQAHLDMNPHLKETGLESSSGLITPDLWLKNCRSRSVSPESELSKSRSPSPPKPHSSTSIHEPASYKPIISVTPASKLMSRNPRTLNVRHLVKHTRKRRNCNDFQNNISNEVENDNTALNLANRLEKEMKSKLYTKKSKNNFLTPNTFAKVHNLCFPFISSNDSSFQQPVETPSSNFTDDQHIHNTWSNFSSAHQPILPTESQSSTNVLTQPLHPSFIPPVTIMVPYPIILPLPIPIPIPLPINNFIKITKQKTEAESGNKSDLRTETNFESHLNEPLDFTTTKLLSDSENEKEKTVETGCRESSCNENESECYGIESIVKSTRLYAKRLNTKESEKSRPLRKRKRIIDYLRSSKDDNDNDQYKK